MVLKDTFSMLIRDQAACCLDVSGADAYIGVSVFHPNPEDGTTHELDLYWRDVPPGRQEIPVPTSVRKLDLGALTCSCGWEGSL